MLSVDLGTYLCSEEFKDYFNDYRLDQRLRSNSSFII